MVACSLFAQAQESGSFKRKIEVRLMAPLLSPQYESSGQSFVAKEVYGTNRYRIGAALGLRYYCANRWYAEYRLGFSPEGGGYRQQYTNANYLKNSLLVGYSARHRHRLIFELFTGIEANRLLRATFHPAQGEAPTNVSSFFRKAYVSIPVGIGLKTKVAKDTWLSLQPYASISISPVTTESYANAYQAVFPAFTVSVSKTINPKRQ